MFVNVGLQGKRLYITSVIRVMGTFIRVSEGIQVFRGMMFVYVFLDFITRGFAQASAHTHRHTHTDTHRQTDRQTDRHTHTHTHTHTHIPGTTRDFAEAAPPEFAKQVFSIECVLHIMTSF